MIELGPSARRRRAVAGIVALLAVIVSLSACGSNDGDASRPTVPSTTVATTTSSTTSTTATSTSTTTSTTSSTTTTSTLPRQLTQPIAPPQDQRGPENNPPIGRVAIPVLGLDAELEEGIRLTTLDRGPGHWPGSAMPGELGNVVVAGHRTSHNAEFRELDRLIPGDEVEFTTDTGTYTYSVTGTEIVGPDALWIASRTDTATATLFACHPLGSTAKRIVVHLDLVV